MSTVQNKTQILSDQKWKGPSYFFFVLDVPPPEVNFAQAETMNKMILFKPNS